ALGRSEICLPKRFLTDLDREQQRTALAHELAHLVRRDPLWELFAGVVQALFFFQPFHRIARLELRSASENLCDDWAVRQTGSPLGLARCLTDVAGWIGADREPLPAGMIAMAEGGSSLLSRVRRLTADELPEPRGLGLRLAVAALLLGLTAAAAPAISLTIRGAGQEDAGESNAAAPEATALSRDSVIFHPDPSLPLSERWRWALQQDLPGGFWIAWGIDSLGGDVAESGVSSNSPGPGGHTPGAPALPTILADIPGQAPAVAFIFGFDRDGNAARDIDWIRIRSAAEPLDLTGRPLLWLGGAGAGESLAHLETLYAALTNPALRKEIAAAFTLHAGPGRVLEATAAALEREADPEVRAEAVQWLPRSQPASEELTALLLEIAFSDPSRDVRIEAVDALAAVDSPSATRALDRIADDHPDVDARSEAAQALERPER
ncbi:MAG TPA: M56 family metallopeptidase, partial [Gemmatimonadota bacterium]|nr:M56 family metallopeptidase [Gemmatimonadota bacterium]